ncbi:MAG: hypothetical protein IKI20_04215 [Lachnospiraceae bacterium]|nr:hypothetical protein [Lachnospiraceae bacterium]
MFYELEKGSGTQFDPAITPILISLMDRGEMNPETIEGNAVDESGEVIPELKEKMKNSDTYIQYTEDCRILALYDRSDEEMREITEVIQNASSGNTLISGL